MTWESKELFSKKDLWFLQTELSAKERNKFKLFSSSQDYNKIPMHVLLKKITSSVERFKQLILLFDNFKFNEFELENQIMSRAELEFCMNKKIHQLGPLALQFQGSKSILTKPLVAIIGSRHPTFYGREQAFRFAKELSSWGCTILSGGAIGVDSIANSVALERGGGSCAILGSGLKNLYPPSNYFLFNQLKHSQDGLILSEFSANEPPQKWNFPKRNHTIALLADFVLIIEAAYTSGSLITANAALEYGTDVGAIPGSVDCENSEGANSLIQNGAYCIQKPQDVLERVESIFAYRATKGY